ncbi:adhesin [Pluralibacter sp.]|jgi:filamentous hemagglutinin|uniref:adhesin n=1 Tax=Pluralibacter sp. TaxID=1920032 RepID=UPI0025F8928F|nr:adhesin [Pluralibacter sp.]MBV8044548.1 adhesin [Pluralibacter sp.]
MQQEKPLVTHGKKREKPLSSQQCAPDRVVAENNALSNGFKLSKGMMDYGQAQGSLMGNTNLVDENGNVMNPMSDEEKAKASQHMAEGDMPDSTNITKVFVNGYKDGVMLASDAYLGPVATAGKVVGGIVIAEIANGTYQWFDINSEQNLSLPVSQQKTWDFKSSLSVGVSAALVAGRGPLEGLGIAYGGTLFTDGADPGAFAGTTSGWVFGSVVNVVAPPVLSPVLGTGGAPIGDIIGSLGGEFIGNAVKDEVNKNDKK